MIEIAWFGFMIASVVCVGLAIGLVIGSLQRRRRGLPVDPGTVPLAVIFVALAWLLAAACAATWMGSGS
jgi:hypothetical protein